MKNKIKILAISHSFLKKINTKMYLILKNEYNFDIQLMSPKFHVDLKKKIYPDFKANEINIDITFSKTIFNQLRFKIYKDILKKIKKEKINNIFLDVDIISLQSLILIFCSFYFNYKVCYFSNENNIIEEKNWLKKKLKFLLIRTFYLFFRTKIFKIFCYTNQIKANLDHCGLKEKTIIIPLGFDNKKFNRTSRIQNNQKFIISYFGKVDPKKGVHTLIKALKLLSFEDWIFTLDLYDISSLSYYRSIKSDLRKLHSKNKLKLIKCNHDNINQFMKKSDLTIVPSEWNEQYGRVIQESAACGSIVIGSKIGAIPEIISNEDFLFEPKNTFLLKEKIENVYFNFEIFRAKFNEVEKAINEKRSINNQAKLINKIFL
ncbi:glycosyltransferase [Candidatus Pelagibacter sp.]|uniref:glycosyltransferase n=1 Tax=Candidatus Pelagibacter sp. TaxID=2024849 RepID=UPI003F82C1FA